MSTHNIRFYEEMAKMSHVMGKPAFCICENKDADQLHGDLEADQHLCFRYTDSAIPLLSKSEISSLQPSCEVVQPGLCRTWSETPKTGFLTTRLKLSFNYHYLFFWLMYCRFGNVRENLVFANIHEIVASRFQSSR